VEPVHHERTSATDGRLFESAARAGGLAVSVSELAGLAAGESAISQS
jgi:hypothetical protein